MHRLLFVLILPGLAACDPNIQTTSGQSFIEAAPDQIDPEIAKAANIEPNLHFPARIGIARIVNGQLTLPPSEEIALFANVFERSRNYGEFIPVSPLVHAMLNDRTTGINARYHHRNAQDIIQQIRLTSARQHLDYVIIYEVGARSSTGNTPFALADVTLVGGMLLPTRQIDVAGIGAAAFIDVRNGYPYGTTQVTTDLTGFSRTFQADRQSAMLRAQATLQVAKALVPKIEDMLANLALAAN